MGAEVLNHIVLEIADSAKGNRVGLKFLLGSMGEGEARDGDFHDALFAGCEIESKTSRVFLQGKSMFPDRDSSSSTSSPGVDLVPVGNALRDFSRRKVHIESYRGDLFYEIDRNHLGSKGEVELVGAGSGQLIAIELVFRRPMGKGRNRAELLASSPSSPCVNIRRCRRADKGEGIERGIEWKNLLSLASSEVLSDELGLKGEEIGVRSPLEVAF